MKKFLITVFILIILAGAGLFFGWAQLGVPPDSIGLIRSKTHGTDPNPIKPGEFRWIWYKLIPTNVKTAVFRISPVHHTFSAKNLLPSGNIYAAFTGIAENNFSWELRANLAFTLRSEALASLVINHNIANQEELTFYEQDIANQIEAFILRSVNAGNTIAIEALLKNGNSPELEQQILHEFPDIAHFSITVQSARIPDFLLYNQAKELYDKYIALQKEQTAAHMQIRVADRLDSYQRFVELEQYGILLSKYPVLLEYLMLQSGHTLKKE